MARVVNPLFSLSASGSIGKMITFKQTPGGAVVTRKAEPYKQQSENQLLNQQTMHSALAAFKTLSTTDLARWRAVAVKKGISAWAEFFFEYHVQSVVHPGMPLIPAANL